MKAPKEIWRHKSGYMSIEEPKEFLNEYKRYILDEWIPVSDPPDEEGEYLCCSEHRYRSKAEYNFDTGFPDWVSWYRPLPNPPEEK